MPTVGDGLGTAWVNILPGGFADFAAKAKAGIDGALKGVTGTVKVEADTSAAIRQLADFQARATALQKVLGNLQTRADTTAAAASIGKLQLQLATLQKMARELAIAGDTTKLDAAIAAEEARLAALQRQASDLQLDADATRAAAKIAALQKQAADLYDKLDNLESDVDITAAITKIYAIEAELRVLQSEARNIEFAAKTTAINADIAVVQANIARLQAQARDVQLGTVDPLKLAALNQGLLSITAAAEKMNTSLDKTKGATGAAAVGMTTLGALVNAAGGWWGVLNTKIPLFGNLLRGILPDLLNQVSVWHLTADAILEIGVITAEAGFAFGAFAIAGSDAAVAIQRRMQALHTVMDATGQAVPPMTNALENLHKAVQPQVYQLFGDALLIMNKRSGEFATVAQQTGVVVDQLAARFTYAVTNGTAVSKFMQEAHTYAKLLGDTIGNLGGILGNVFNVLPGYALILLRFADGFTHVLEVATRIAAPIIGVGLAIHGFLLWVGLAVTGTLAFVGAMAKLIAAFGIFSAEGAIATGAATLRAFTTWVVNAAIRLYLLGAAFVSVAADEGVFAAASALLGAVNPLVWVGAAVLALGALVFWLSTSKDAAQQFNDSMQQMITNAKVTDLVSTIQQAQTETAGKLAGAQKDLNNALKEQAPLVTGQASKYDQNYNPAVDHAAQSVQQLSDAQKTLNDQHQLVQGRLDQLTKQYGSQTAALGALNLAGITSAQILDKNNEHWLQTLIQVNSTTDAYKAMGSQAGQLGNDLDVLGRTATDQYQAVQKLNQAWTQFISDVTSGQTSFDTFAQGLTNLDNQSGRITLNLGKLRTSFVDQKAAIDQLTPSGIALNQAFADQVTNASKMYETWRTAGVANNLFVQGVAASIAPLEKYAVGSQEATAQLVALGEQAGYQGPISLQALNKYLGITSGQLQNTSGDTKTLKDVANQATTQEALLTTAMQNQGSYIANQLIGDINGAILQYDGVKTAAQNYGTAIAQAGRESDQAHAARKILIDDLIASGTAAGDSKQQIAEMITKITGIPIKVALQIVMTGDGSYTITQALGGGRSVVVSGPTTGQIRAIGGHTQHGLYLHPNAGVPGRDSVPLMAMPGELVVPANMTEVVRPVLGGKIPGFAAGGVVANPLLAGNTSVLTGQYAVDMANAFETQMADTMVARMAAALKSAEKAAAAAIGGARGAGGVGYAAGPAASGTAAAAQAYAKSILWAYGWGLDQFAPLLALWNQESGWNAWAVNPSSGAYGIPQALPSAQGHPYNLGDYANQVRWGLAYISGRYGSPGAAEAHELAYNWYAHGGIVRGMAGGGLVPGYVTDLGADTTVTTTGHLLPGMAAGGYIPAPVPKLSSFFTSTAALRSALAAAQKGEQEKFFGLTHSFQIGFSHNPPKGSWLARNRRLLTRELTTLATRHQAETAAYRALSGSGLTPAGLQHLGSMAREETLTAQDLLFSAPALKPNWAGGHPLWDVALRQDLAKVIAISNLVGTGANYKLPVMSAVSDVLGTTTPGAPGPVITDVTGRTLAMALSPLGMAGGGLVGRSFDSGGYLSPGWNLAWNGSGTPEPVGHGNVSITLTVASSGSSDFDKFMVTWLRKSVKIRGGGSVQRAYGTH